MTATGDAQPRDVERLLRPPTFEDGQALFDAVCTRGLEGVVAKREREPYRPGERIWAKVKNRETRRFAEELEGVRRAVAMGRRSNARALTRLDPAFHVRRARAGIVVGRLQKEELCLWSHGNKLKRRLELEGLAERDATCAVPLLGARVRGALATSGDRA